MNGPLMLLRTLALAGCLALFAACAAAQPTPCEAAPAGYEGPCFYGALPAFFDDFAYTSAATTGPVAEAPEGDLFGPNAWHTRRGTEQTRAWYRYNRGNPPIPGTVTPGSGSVLAIQLPAGHSPRHHPRDPMIYSAFTARHGTWHWRVRFSELQQGQRLRQAVWTMGPAFYVFEHPSPSDTARYRYWSELDFEFENFFQGEHRGGRFYPDWVSRMSVGNHYGRRESLPRARLSREGPAAWEAGRGTLLRTGPAQAPEPAAAPLTDLRPDAWYHLLMEVNDRTRTVTYRMFSEGSSPALRALADRTVTVGDAFFPEDPMHMFLSLHWIEPEAPLRLPVSLEVDWAYYTPVTGLSDDAVRQQVSLLRQHGLPRANTTELPTYTDWARPPGLRIDGPRHVHCGETGSWTVTATRSGIFHTTFRYRLRHRDGRLTPWQEVYERTVTLTPEPGQAGLVLEASTRDRWAPRGAVEDARGWLYPHPENLSARAHHTVAFTCEAP